jgi:hypothetical protein
LPAIGAVFFQNARTYDGQPEANLSSEAKWKIMAAVSSPQMAKRGRKKYEMINL